MTRRRRTIRGLLLVAPGWIALVAIGCPCQPPDGPALKDPCGAGQSRGVFAAAADEALLVELRRKQAFWIEEAPPPTEEALATGCCNFFNERLKGGFCQAEVDRFCDARCPDAAARQECKGPHRASAGMRCAEEALGLLHREVAVCGEMGLLGVNTTWPWGGGPHALCPRAE